MTSLYKRATPSQIRILRAVEGAVKNATDAHPELRIGPHHRRSIAKRAAGTLTAQWPDVLALRESVSSDSGATEMLTSARRQSSNRMMAIRRGTIYGPNRPALRHLRSKLTYAMKRIKREEHPEYAHAMIDVLKMIAALQAPTDRMGDD